MDIILPAIVVIAILASFGLSYMSFKTWRVFQVILVSLVFLATLPFCYLAVRTLKIHSAWRQEVITKQKQIDQLEIENHDLEEGAVEKDATLLGIRELKSRLHDAVRDRGGVWRNVSPGQIDEKGAVQFTLKDAEPHGIQPKMVLFLFEDKPAKGEGASHYLGEFRVTEAAEKNKSVTLEPNLPLTETELGDLQKSRGPWTVYAIMPIDNAEMFAKMTADERAKLLPPESVEEYAKKDRQLRDYGYLFWDDYRAKLQTQATMVDVERQLKSTEAAIVLAERDIKLRKAEAARLSSDLGWFKKERDVATTLAADLNAQLRARLAKLRELYLSNHAQAAEISALQTEAADRIDARTGEQAKADTPRSLIP